MNIYIKTFFAIFIISGVLMSFRTLVYLRAVTTTDVAILAVYLVSALGLLGAAVLAYSSK